MKPEIFIRADGSPKIGLGHLVRCLALAQMLENDFEISFVCKEIPETMYSELNEKGFGLTKIQGEKDFFNLLNANSIVILDGYHFDTNYQKQIKLAGSVLICIDDLHVKEFVADLIINHTSGTTSHDYNAQPYTKFALGLGYALLRPAFLEQAKLNRKIEKIETVMICFGGADPHNLTQIALQTVKEIKHFKKIIVITGHLFNFTKEFKKIVKNDSRIELRHALNIDKMIETMIESDLAVVPASGILLEVLSIGMPSISGYYVDNQIKSSITLEKMGLISSVGNMLVNFEENLKEKINFNIHLGKNLNQIIFEQKKSIGNLNHTLPAILKSIIHDRS